MSGMRQGPAADQQGFIPLAQQARENPASFIQNYFFSSEPVLTKVILIPNLLLPEREPVVRAADERGLRTAFVGSDPNGLLVIGYQEQTVSRKAAEFDAVVQSQIQAKMKSDRILARKRKETQRRQQAATERQEKKKEELVARNLEVEEQHKAFVMSHSGASSITGVWKVQCAAIAKEHPRYSGKFNLNISFEPPEQSKQSWGYFNFGVVEGVIKLQQDLPVVGNSGFDWQGKDGEGGEEEVEERNGEIQQGRGHLSLLAPSQMQGFFVMISPFALFMYEFQALRVSSTPSKWTIGHWQKMEVEEALASREKYYADHKDDPEEDAKLEAATKMLSAHGGFMFQEMMRMHCSDQLLDYRHSDYSDSDYSDPDFYSDFDSD